MGNGQHRRYRQSDHCRWPFLFETEADGAARVVVGGHRTIFPNRHAIGGEIDIRGLPYRIVGSKSRNCFEFRRTTSL